MSKFFSLLHSIERMDLNKTGVSFPGNGELIKNVNFGDMSLRLDCLGYRPSKHARSGHSGSNHGVFSSKFPDDGCKLVLGLGPTPNSYCDDQYPVVVNKSKESATTVVPESFKGDSGTLKLSFLGTDDAFDVHETSVSAKSNLNTSYTQNQMFAVDEGSTSAKASGGYMPSLLLAPRLDSSKVLLETRELFEPGTSVQDHHPHLSPEPSVTTDYSTGTVSHSASHRSHHPKKCRFEGCPKGARGASGLCIAHGGGQRCQKPGCNKGAESRTAYCKAHGGGRRCLQLGCTKSAEGKTDFCIAHGGGRRCEHPGCTKAARGKSGRCIKHGGGKRCKVEGCTRSAEGQVGLCISHGGGRRCQYLGCTKGAQGSTMHCKAHGGGKRCIFSGCTKGAEGSTPLCKGHGGGKRCQFEGGGICPKSVHGGTDYCVAHGGGKRCVIPGCTKSARGRTDCCVRHGGGKRCQFENCGKSAQGSTDFCKAHGGGKRCMWGQGTCEKFSRGKSGLCAAHSSMVQDREIGKGGMIGPGLFHGLVSISPVGSSLDNDYSSGASAISDCIDSQEKPAKRQRLIHPQVLVPLTMKSSSSSGSLGPEKKEEGGNRNGGSKSFDFMIPEGRVHGGGLMSLLGGSLRNTIDGI